MTFGHDRHYQRLFHALICICWFIIYYWPFKRKQTVSYWHSNKVTFILTFILTLILTYLYSYIYSLLFVFLRWSFMVCSFMSGLSYCNVCMVCKVLQYLFFSLHGFLHGSTTPNISKSIYFHFFIYDTTSLSRIRIPQSFWIPFCIIWIYVLLVVSTHETMKLIFIIWKWNGHSILIS